MKPVGILGGMGPEATILLMQRVLTSVPARDDADHIPLIVHQNPQVPSRIKALIDGTGTDPGSVLAEMAQGLAAAGAKALAMPCNTAHHYAPDIVAATDLPFLNMIDITARQLSRYGASKIGMLASPATRKTGVFDAAFGAYGLTPVWTQDEAAMLSLIRAIKAGQGAETSGPEFAQLGAGLVINGADHLLIACTELSLLTHLLPENTPRTDSLDCLAAAIVEFAQET